MGHVKKFMTQDNMLIFIIKETVLYVLSFWDTMGQVAWDILKVLRDKMDMRINVSWDIKINKEFVENANHLCLLIKTKNDTLVHGFTCPIIGCQNFDTLVH